MRLLAVSLQKGPDGALSIRFKLFKVVKETQTGFKIAKPHELLEGLDMVKKHQIDKLIFIEDKSNKRECRGCKSLDYKIYVWALIDGEDPNYELLRYWRKEIKDAVINDLRSKNDKIKSLYKEVNAL